MSFAKWLSVVVVSSALFAVHHRAGAQTFSVVHTFTGGHDGLAPTSGLIAHSRFLYGTTDLSVGSLDGTIFRIDPDSGRVVTRHSFGLLPGDGIQPLGGLIRHGGFLYGTTFQGGVFNNGTLFKLELATNTETVVHSFGGTGDGSLPVTSVIYHNGFLFGTTYSGAGGACDCGTVFKVDAGTGQETVLYRFTGRDDGTTPSSLVYFADALYGSTANGGGTACGGAGCGTVFKIDPATGSKKTRYRFANSLDGSEPYSLLVQNGLLFGVTVTGGGTGCFFSLPGCGTIFSFDPQSGTKTVLYRFKGMADDGNPGGLIYQDGVFYGTSEQTTYGSIFKFDPVSGTVTVLHEFTNSADGRYPDPNMVYQAGALYGTANQGGSFAGPCGADGCGTIFKLVP